MRDLPPGFFPLPRDTALPAQGYAIHADREGVRVAHADDAGRRYAEDALAQLATAIQEQRACWLARARPGGLADSVARLERAQAELGA